MELELGENNNDFELLKRMEDEHCRLQRQVRAIQFDRLQVSAGIHPLFRRQDKLLKVLRHEYLELVRNLKTASSGYHKKRDRTMKRKLKDQLLFKEKLDQQSEVGLTITQQMEDLLRGETKELLTLREQVNANMGQIKERREESERRLVKTENRLEVAKHRFNITQNENKKIREEIESMLKDRMLFNRDWSRMLNALNKGKKFLTDLFESSTLAYDQRDEWVAKLRSMQEKGKVDQLVQLQEMRDYQKLVDHELKLYQFLARKGVIRINKHVEEKEEKMKKMEAEAMKNEIEDHLKVLDDISEYTHTENADKIIFSFQQKEQENFSIYELLTNYCAENVMLEKNLRQIRTMLQDRRDYNESKEAAQDAHKEALTRELDEVRQRNEHLRAKIEEKDQLIKRIVERVTEMFEMLECSVEPFQNLLGDKIPSQWTFNLSVSLINAKIKEYLAAVYYCEHVLKMDSKSQTQAQPKKVRMTLTSSMKKYTVYPNISECFTATPVTQYVPSDPCPACIETRWMSRVIDYLEVPYNKEMVQIALKELVNDPAYMRSDRLHPLADCRAPTSRVILANRYLR